MKPRQPYRSPFWRPDIGGDPVPSMRRVPSVEDRHQTRERQPSSASRPVLEQTVGYEQSDLALFGKLMDYGRPGLPAETPKAGLRPDVRSKPQPAPATPPSVMPSPSAANPAPKDHSNGDLALFRTLQAPFATVRQERIAETGATPGTALPSHGYAQADLDAFERLASFGRPA